MLSNTQLVLPAINVKQNEFPFDINRIKNSIQELNLMAGEGTSKVVKEIDGTYKLRIPEALALRIYKNGIFFRDGPFRPFKTDSCALDFVKDIQDGYFPLELKDEYPEGVSFLFTDCHTETYLSNAYSGSFENDNFETLDISHSLCDIQSIHSSFKTQSFVSKLPKYIIKNGNVINVRSEITSLLNSSKTEERNNEVVEIKTEVDRKCSPRPPSQNDCVNVFHHRRIRTVPAFCTHQQDQEVSNIRVKIPGTLKDATLKLFGHQKISDLKGYLEPVLFSGKDIKSDYELRTAFQAGPHLPHMTLKVLL